jgi:pilus assembly protein Flp/PilA
MSMQSQEAVAALLRRAIRKFRTSEEGQDLLEYALLVALIALVAIAAVAASGTAVSDIFTAVAGKLAGAAS